MRVSPVTSDTNRVNENTLHKGDNFTYIQQNGRVGEGGQQKTTPR